MKAEELRRFFLDRGWAIRMPDDALSPYREPFSELADRLALEPQVDIPTLVTALKMAAPIIEGATHEYAANLVAGVYRVLAESSSQPVGGED